MAKTADTVNPFEFKFQNSIVIRTVAIDGEVWFCANDVCKVLGYVNSRDAIANHCKEKGVAIRDTLTAGGKQALTYINEPNLYRLAIRSKKPEAERFETWVMEEVLPAIRKNGYYSINITRAQAGELSALIADRFEGGQRPYAWSRFNNHFRLASYRDLPANRFDEAVAYIKTIPVPQSRAIRYEAKSRYFPTAMQSHALVELSKYIDKLDGFDRKHSKDFLDYLDRTMTSEWTDVDAAIIGAFSQLLRLRVLKKELKVI